MYGYIYLTTNLINNKKYIGKHKASQFEPNKYIGSGTDLLSDIMIFGKNNFYCQFIKACYSDTELYEEEKYYIRLYNAVSHSDFYNLSGGGNYVYVGNKISDAVKGKRKSDIHRYHLSQSKKGKYTGEHNSNFGNHLSLEAKNKISIANKGKTAWNKNKRSMFSHSDNWKQQHSLRMQGSNNPAARAVIQLTLDNKYVAQYDTIREAQQKTKICSISACCKHKQKTAGGYIWRYKEDVDIELSEN